MPVIGMCAVAIVFMLWFSFVYVMYRVGGMSQQCDSYVMASAACIVCMRCSWSHNPMSSSTGKSGEV